MTTADKLRIVSICRTFPSPTDPSSGVFVLNRVKGMAVHAHVDAIQTVPYFPGVKSLPQWARAPERYQENLRIRTAPMLYVPGAFKSLDASWLARAAQPIVAKLAGSGHLDAIDAHFGYPDGVGASMVASALGLPCFITIRGFEMEFLSRAVIGRKMINALRNATGVVAVSDSLRRVAVARGVDPERIKTIHNAIDSRVFHYRESAAARAELGLPTGRKLILSIGHLIPRKRHKVLIEAFARMSGASSEECRLAIIGSSDADRSHAEEIGRTIAEHRLGSRVTLLGNVPQSVVASWLQACDVFALATAREGCCNAVLEALASGAPVVTTPAGDNSLFIDEGRSGFIVPIGDSDTLSFALSKALGMTWDRPAISERATRQVGGWANVGARVVQFFRQSLSSSTATVRQ